MRRSLHLCSTGLALVLLAVGCGRCEKPPPPAARAPETFVAPDAQVVFLVPSLGALADRGKEILARLRASPAGAEIVLAHESLVAQLGLDPLERAALARVGLDPERGLALAQKSDGSEPVLIVAARDTATLHDVIAELATRRLGAKDKSERTVGGVRVKVFSAQAGGPPALSLATAPGWMAIAPGASGPERAAAAVARAAEQSLSRSPRFERAAKVLGKRDALLLALPVLAFGSGRGALALPELALGLTLAPGQITLRAHVTMSEPAREKLWRALPGGGQSVVRALPAQALVRLRLGVAPRALLDILTAGDDAAARALRDLVDRVEKRGVKVGDEVLALVRPGVALSLDLAPGADLSRALMLDPRRANPFQTWTLRAAAQLADPAKARASIERLAGAAPAIGATVKKRQENGAPVWSASYRLGEGLSWTLDRDTIVAWGGGQRAAPSGEPPAGPSALAGEAAAEMFVDLQPLAEQLRNLPPEAFGTGPSGMMARSMAEQLIEPLKQLKIYAALAPADGGAAIDVSVTTP